ncbi:MAG TPA: hypothetical protein PLX08_09525 [Bacteroidales bacterium]|jgi:hypothetical protein|nr:hypothetical protein [Bacteroidales bacterium]
MNHIKEFAESLPVRTIQTGSEREEAPMKVLSAGNVTAIWDGISLRFIKAAGIELLTMIYPALRDSKWQAVSPEVINEEVLQDKTSFSVKLRCRYKTSEIDFVADYLYEGTGENSIIVTMEGQALESFQKNRLGWCVLHPVEGNAGEKCLVELRNGTFEHSVFPLAVSPFQVFTNIRSMSWTREGISCKLDFEGDVFETEDQRNWTDASFKTYSTPLSLPHPVWIEKGSKIFQKVQLNVSGNFDTPRMQDNRVIVRLFPEETFRLPGIGTCRKSEDGCILSENEIKLLRPLRFDHYRVDFHLSKPEWRKEADIASAESHDLGIPVEAALFFDDHYEAEIKDFISWQSEAKILISNVLLFHVSLPVIPDERSGQIIRLLRDKDPQINVATGTNSDFLHLNRERPGDSRNDSVCFSVTPQVFLSDDLTVAANLRAQGDAVRSAKGFSGNKKIVVSPVNIHGRLRKEDQHEMTKKAPYCLPSDVDARQMSLFGACWTAISLKYLSEAGADSVTFYETAGERGIIQGDSDSRWPGIFRSCRGMIFPVYHVLRFILGNKSLTGIKSISSKPTEVDCFALSDGKQARIILVNFTDGIRTVSLECCSGLFRIRTLDSETYPDAVSNSRWTGIEKEKVIKAQSNFEISPYSVSLIEGWRKH